jgi:3-oxoacyl-[acyl-carrier protein] reductase
MSAEPILITGASSDIGRALVRRLLESSETASVLAHSHRSADKLASLKEEFGARLSLVQADFSQAPSVAQMVEQIAREHGTPGSIVHLPALRLTHERFTKFHWERFEEDMAVQVRSAIIVLKAFLPKMAKLPRARVLFVLSSVVHGVPPKYMTMYTTLKYTQLGLMRSLAAEYASTSVRINAISPSMVETQFLSEISEIAVQMSASANPQGRNATTQDLLGAMELLLSPASDYIHGVDLPIAAGGV